MADPVNPEKNTSKSPHAEREERVLSVWKEKNTFAKTLKKNEGKKEFVFYEGPPTANGRPGIHHLEARAFKDAIPRYKTMRGFHVRRKGGWDTHGLPVELQVEKELGLKSKKEIETYGVGAFNEKCKESVWKYVHEWEDFTNRMGYWVDLKDPYITYKPNYIESLWNIVKTVDSKDLLYKDYKVVPWCPRCGTGLSSHELAQGYQDVKDLAVTVKFKIKQFDKGTIKQFAGDTYLLAWTTTPWTLPGNVGLAVGKDIEYVKARIAPKTVIQPIGAGTYEADSVDMVYIAKDILKKYTEVRKGIFQVGAHDLIVEQENIFGRDLIGLEYEPLYPFLKDNISGAEKEKMNNAYKVYAAEFVTTTDGTGIVHTAVMYGQDDFELGTKVGLPKYHLVNDDGTFKKEAGFLAGKFVRDEATAVEIIKDLANRPTGSLLFHKEKHEHSYPFCWRCKTPLIYFARDSWYIKMSALRDELIAENKDINWEPAHIKEGRFGEWLREVKDWAISRERYWGTPLPVWICDTCHEKKVIGSVAEIARPSKNTYTVMRHGEAEHNTLNILNSDPSKPYHLTEKGKEEVVRVTKSYKGKIDLIYYSPLPRAKETAFIVADVLGMSHEALIADDRLREAGMGELEGKPVEHYTEAFPAHSDHFATSVHGAESRLDIKKRMGAFLDSVEAKHEGKHILIVSHDSPLWMCASAARCLDIEQSFLLKPNGDLFLKNAEMRLIDHPILPHNTDYELDLHRPHIDTVKLSCKCGAEMSRVKEVMDVWFDSGAMPFAQDHYPFENRDTGDKKHENILSKFFSSHKNQEIAYPADFISEAIDQTRGWFYTLHAIGVLMGKGKAFKNVICLGHILDKEGKKMSKSIGNVVDPWAMMNVYGADALRFWMYSVNQPGDAKNFDEKTVDEMVKKVFNLATNVLSFYKMYEEEEGGSMEKGEGRDHKSVPTSSHILDRWIIARLNQVIETATKGLDAYSFFEPTRAIRDFVGDLSQWYLRRSRDRFKGEDVVDKEMALATTRYVLVTLAKVMAPLTPFFAEYLYQEVGGGLESVHLEEWPEEGKVDTDLITNMNMVRSFASVGLMKRTEAKINVRQPLASFTLKIKHEGKSIKYWDELKEILKDEINVKDVVLGFATGDNADVYELDTRITDTLKEEGTVRELIRLIQDLRKARGLNVGDKAILDVETDGAGRKLIDANTAQIKAACSISDIRFVTMVGESVIFGGIPFKVEIKV